MRRKDKETTLLEAYEVIDECVYATLAVAQPGGAPYCVPLSIAREENNIYFHCATLGKKLDCLKENNKVCLSCVSRAENMTDKFSVFYDSAIVDGLAFEVTEREEKIKALRLISERHVPGMMHTFEEEIEKYFTRTAVWRIEAKEITGKKGRI